jgi:hypothetical protein
MCGPVIATERGTWRVDPVVRINWLPLSVIEHQEERGIWPGGCLCRQIEQAGRSELRRVEAVALSSPPLGGSLFDLLPTEGRRGGAGKGR